MTQCANEIGTLAYLQTKRYLLYTFFSYICLFFFLFGLNFPHIRFFHILFLVQDFRICFFQIIYLVQDFPDIFFIYLFLSLDISYFHNLLSVQIFPIFCFQFYFSVSEFSWYLVFRYFFHVQNFPDLSFFLIFFFLFTIFLIFSFSIVSSWRWISIISLFSSLHFYRSLIISVMIFSFFFLTFQCIYDCALCILSPF